jgi:GTP cyclohydrolase IA
MGMIASLIKAILVQLGEDTERDGLIDTPKRVEKYWAEATSGITEDISQHLVMFESDGWDEIIIAQNIKFYSHCEHHMASYSGMVHIGYLPGTKVIGISKLARIVNIFAKRLQIQERMTKQIADTLEQALEPKGIACVIEAEHLCVKSRGVMQQEMIIKTSAMRGVFRDSPAARDEFLRLIGR